MPRSQIVLDVVNYRWSALSRSKQYHLMNAHSHYPGSLKGNFVVSHDSYTSRVLGADNIDYTHSLKMLAWFLT